MSDVRSYLQFLFAGLMVLCLAGCSGRCSQHADKQQGVPVIFDTDMGGDVDDAGALAMLQAMADMGQAKILAAMSANRNPLSAAAIDVINTYYGRGDLPIGSSKTGPNLEKTNYDNADEFLHDLQSGDEAPDAVDLYRRILAGQPDNSVVIVVVGWLTNMADLLDSKPDQYSPLNGRELVKAKVRELVSMGGIWPNTKHFNIRYREYNFRMDAAAAHKVISDWPGKIMFTALGKDVMTGGRLVAEAPADNPVPHFYRKFFKKYKITERTSCDQVAVLYAVRGLSDYFTSVNRGRCIGKADGTNEWIPGPASSHSYLVYKMPPNQLAAIIEDLMLMPPARGYR